MRVLLTGASGFVGRVVLRALVGRGHEVHGLARNGGGGGIGGGEQAGVRWFRGSVTDHAAVNAAARGCEGAIHLVGIIMENPRSGVTFHSVHIEGTRVVLAACKQAGIARYVHMSALGTRENAVSEYHGTKWGAEELVRASDIQWTIFRPGLIHGPGGEFTAMVAGWARGTKFPWVFMPYFGPGLLGMGRPAKVQPVYVEEVARAFVEALGKSECAGRAYDLVGKESLDWREMYQVMSIQWRGKPKSAVGVPAWYARLLTRVMPAPLLPFDRGQVQMAMEEGVGDSVPFEKDFGWRPRGVRETLGLYSV